MLDSTDKTFFKNVKDQIIKWLIGLILATIVSGVTFYFTTTATLSAHETKLKTIDDLNNDHSARLTAVEKLVVALATNPELTNVQIANILKTVEDIQQRQIKSDDRLDKLYDEVIKIIRERR